MEPGSGNAALSQIKVLALELSKRVRHPRLQLAGDDDRGRVGLNRGCDHFHGVAAGPERCPGESGFHLYADAASADSPPCDYRTKATNRVLRSGVTGRVSHPPGSAHRAKHPNVPLGCW